MSAWHGGKGSSPRQVNKDKFDSNWDKIFKGKKDVTTKPDTKDNEKLLRSRHKETRNGD